MADNQNNAGAGKKLTEEQREYLKYIELEEKSRTRSYDLATLMGEEIAKQKGKMQDIRNSSAEIHANIKRTAAEYEKQQKIVNVLGERQRVQAAELVKQKQKTIALEAAQAADAQKQVNFEQAKIRAQQTVNNLQQDATRLKQKEKDLTRDLRDAMRAGDTAAVARIQREQAALARQQASNKGNMTQARNRLALAETELNTVNSTMAARAKELKQSKEDEQLKEKALNATSEQLDYAKTMADYKKRVMDDTRAFGETELARLEQEYDLETLTLDKMRKKQQVVEAIDGFLGATSQEYGKTKSLIMDIAKGGATAWLAVIKASLERWAELDAAAANFRNNTKLIVTQTRQLDRAAREVNVQLQSMGVSIGEVYETAQSLTQEFQVVGLVTKEMMADTAQMSASIGVAVADSAKFRGLFTSISKSAGMTATQSMQATAALAEMAGVAPAAVLKDMAEASGETLSFLAKSPIALMKASVEARRLGTTVNSLSKSARGFLNYQESITSELEASALIGKSLNFQEARAAAYAGDVVKSRELALKQLEKAGDFTKLNVYQQEALAKAAGMTVDEVIKQQNQQKMLAEFRANATGKDKEMLDKYEATQKKIAENEKAAKEDLVGRGREMVKQQMIQSEMNKLQNAFKSIWTDITDALLPIANNIMPIILITARAIGMVFKVIGALVRGFLSIFDVFGKTMRSGEEGGLKLEEIMAAIGKKLDEWSPILEKVGEAIAYILTGVNFVLAALGNVNRYGKVIGGPFRTIAAMMFNISRGVSAFAAGLSGTSSLLAPILKTVSGLFRFFGNFAKVLGPIGLVITAVQILWKWISSMVDIFKRDDLDLFEKLGASLAALGTAIWDVLVQPIIDAVAWILNKIWPGLGDGMLDGIKKIGSILYKYTIQPFVDAYLAIKNIFTGDEGIGTRILNAISSIGGSLLDLLIAPFKIVWEFVSSMFSGGIIDSILGGLKSAGEAILSVITWPFRKMWEFVSGLFSGEGSGIIDSIISGLKSVNEAILNVLTWPFRKMWEFVSGLFGGEGSGIIDSIISGLKSVNEAIINVLTWPFRKMWEFVSGLFSGDGGGESIIGSILGGLKSAASGIIDTLTWPFRKMWEFVTGLFSGEGSGIIGSIIDGIKNAVGKIFDILTWPFRKVVDLVSGLFGGDGQLGSKIIGGIKTIGEFIFDTFKKIFSTLVDAITWPFRKAFDLVKKIPFISKLFGGNSSDATATVSGEAKVKADGSSTAPVEVKGLTELKDSIVKLTEAITKLNGGAGGTATTGGGAGGGMCCDAVVNKLDQLITLMSEGNIGVNIDGVKASKLLARAST